MTPAMTLPAHEYLRELHDLLLATAVTEEGGRALELEEGCDRAVSWLLERRRTGAKALLVGNGGSAAIASHWQTDLVNGLGLPALVFTDPSLLTCQANDHGYGAAFERPVRLWVRAGDLVLAISSSGRSENILRAVDAARAAGATAMTFSGFAADNPLRGRGSLNFHVASRSYGLVEVAHQTLVHLIHDRALARVGDGS